MTEPEDKPHERRRRSVRLRGFDYALSGAYFVTICTRNRERLFGEIVDGTMRSNDAGRMIETWWHRLSDRFPNIETDAFIVMPNHIHAIIVIKNPDPVGAIPCNRPEPVPDLNPNPNKNMGTDRVRERIRERGDKQMQGDYIESPLRIPNTYDGLGRYVSWFKRMAINEYIRRVETKEFPRFEKSIWQRNYYEHIIRDDREWDTIREYIGKNPEMWERDSLYA